MKPDKPFDYEALHIKNGYLNYFAFNPAPYGAGSTFGAHVKSNFTVNTGELVEVRILAILVTRTPIIK